MNAMIEGAFQFARFFEEIHQKGKVYCSVSPDVFYFNLKNGAFHFEGEELLGEAYVKEPDAAEIEFTEFLAPELAEALAEEQEKLLSETEEQETLETFKECYSLETDRYFMAVYLFEYFFHTGSPFEGKKMVNRCFLSPEEKELFRAREGRFCMEPGEEENIPVKGIQDKLIQYWNEYPEILQKMFQKAFLDGEGLENFVRQRWTGSSSLFVWRWTISPVTVVFTDFLIDCFQRKMEHLPVQSVERFTTH